AATARSVTNPGTFNQGASAAANQAAASGGTSIDAVAVPAFAGHALPDTTGGVIALLGIVLVTSLAAWLTAGQPSFAPATAGGGSTRVLRARPPTGGLVALWFGVLATGVGLVVYQLGPLLEQQDQHNLMVEYKQTLRHAAAASGGLPGTAEVTNPPEVGSAVGVLEIGDLRTQAVIVEGVSSSNTAKGPGHAPGTAGLGQPGNALVVARRNGYGGTFANLDDVHKGARILVTTTQGQSVYRVSSVRDVQLVDDGEEAEGSTGTAAATSTAGAAKAKGARAVSIDNLYGPSDDDRLTLVTSASRAFWNTSDAVVVTAKMVGTPYAPTPQNGRSSSQTGRTGQSDAWAVVVLTLAVFAGAIAASVALYRRVRFRIAYLLTVAPLVALTVVSGETLSRLLPAWM
ncbi:MAG TPA: sortase, partial [Acidimicrobiia bacterium]|nr:sortase [Acidimicrobiia bacterium]